MVEKKVIPPPNPPSEESLLQYKQRIGLNNSDKRHKQQPSKPRLVMQQVIDEEKIVGMDDIVRFFRLSYTAEGALHNLAAERSKFNRELEFEELSQWNAQMDTILLKYEIVDEPARDVMIRAFNKMADIGLLFYADDQTP